MSAASRVRDEPGADFEHHAVNAASFNRGYFWMDRRDNSPFGVGQGPWIWGESLYGNAGTAAERNGYYAIGGRCAKKEVKTVGVP